MCVLSGLLFGLSMPSFPFLPLGFLGWLWLVPLLFELSKTDTFLSFVLRVLTAIGIGFSIMTLWVANASLWGLLASILSGVFVWSVPFLLLYLVRRYIGWTTSIWSLPFLWTAWEWLYHQTEFSFGAVRLGYTQADLIWLIQYSDITGVEGVTFWVVLLNIAFFVFAEKSFSGTTSEVSRATLLNRYAVLPLLLFVMPLGYAASLFLQPEPGDEEITILAVQPNISPFGDYSPKNFPNIFGKQFAMTNLALKERSPDLILWHEVAVPYVLSEDTAANTYLAKQIKKWNVPVLTGLIEVKDYTQDEVRPPLLIAQDRYREYFNSAALFQPAAIENEGFPIDLSAMYHKRRLMPFLENVPFSEEFPPLADLIIPIGSRPRLSSGTRTKTFEFTSRDGRTVKVGTMICYENLYPEMAADAVRDGAQVLMAITNEGFFASSQGQYQLAAFSRFRSIETRRAMVRAASTGMTRATDRFGRTIIEVPMWSEQTLTARVSLSDEQTFYVRYGDWLPKLCLLSLIVLACAAIRGAFGRKECHMLPT